MHEQRRREILERVGEEFITTEDRKNNQSIQFMVDTLPVIRELYPGRNKLITVVDVGARTGAGTALLAKLHGPGTNAKVKMDVAALDISDRFKEYATFC